MATITRYSLANIRDQMLKALGKDGNTNISSRVEYRLTDALFHISTHFFHHELTVFDDTVNLSSGARSATVPTDLWTVVAVGLRASGTFIKWLSGENLRVVYLDLEAGATGQPTSVARQDRTLVFDQKADQAYDLDIVYYKMPTTPDFATSNSSELHWAWDRPLHDYAMALVCEDLGDTAKADRYLAAYERFTAAQAQPLLREHALVDVPTLPTRDRLIGGNQ